MLKAYKYRLNPNTSQKDYFNKTFGCCRFVYNLALETKINAYQSASKTNLSGYDLIKQLPDLKNSYNFLNEVSAMCLQQSILNMETAFKNFYKSTNRSKGFPKFKKKNSRQSCKFNLNIGINFSNHTLKIPKIGPIKFYLDRSFEGKLKSITISKNTAGFYFASCLVETINIKHSKPNNNKIGLDLGIKAFLVDSSGNVYNNPKFYRKNEELLKKYQKRLSRKEKGSKRYEGQRNILARIHYKIACQRQDFLHKLSTNIVNKNQIICIEDLQIANMIKNHKLAKSIQDSSWSEFIRQLEYKSKWQGKELVKVSKWFASSKICHSCGFKNEVLTLANRSWTCNNCNEGHDRDFNAAKNILQEGIRIKSGSGRAKEDVELSAVAGTVKRQVKLEYIV